jgi:hypothetical protein
MGKYLLLAAAIYRQQKVLSHFSVCCWIDCLLMIKNCLIDSGPPCTAEISDVYISSRRWPYVMYLVSQISHLISRLQYTIKGMWTVGYYAVPSTTTLPLLRHLSASSCFLNTQWHAARTRSSLLLLAGAPS